MSSTRVHISEVFPTGAAYKARIHKVGCRDEVTDLRKANAESIGLAEIWAGEYTGQEWLEVNFGDVASDEFEPGTPEWDEELRYQASEVTICPCAKAAGFTFDM